METRGLGAGSYPSPSENSIKMYTFVCDCTCTCEYYVYASSLEEANELFSRKDYDDYDIDNIEVEQVAKIEEGD